MIKKKKTLFKIGLHMLVQFDSNVYFRFFLSFLSTLSVCSVDVRFSLGGVLFVLSDFRLLVSTKLLSFRSLFTARLTRLLIPPVLLSSGKVFTYESNDFCV